MRLVVAIVASLGVAAIEGCATPTAAKNNPMIGLNGGDAAFAAAATRTFPYSRMRCFEAVLATFRNTRGGRVGIARADPVAGTIVSSKWTVYSGTATNSQGQSYQAIVDNQFYVQVGGNDGSCTITVTKLRVWERTVEVATRQRGWVEAHLRGLMKGVEEEASSPSPPGASQVPGSEL